jgi:hypothetical protein
MDRPPSHGRRALILASLRGQTGNAVTARRLAALLRHAGWDAALVDIREVRRCL